MKREKALRILYEESFLKDEKTLDSALLQKAVDSLHPDEIKPALSAEAALGNFYDRNGIERPELSGKKTKAWLAGSWRKWALSGSCLLVLLVCISLAPSLMKTKPAEEAIASSIAEKAESMREASGLKQELSVVGTYGAANNTSSIDSSALNESQLERIWDFLKSVDIFNAFNSPMIFCTEKTDSSYEIVLDVSYQDDEIELVFNCDSEIAYEEMKNENSFVRFFEKLLSLFFNEDLEIVDY